MAWACTTQATHVHSTGLHPIMEVTHAPRPAQPRFPHILSVHAISWVLRYSEAELGDRLVLIVLADHAHADGTKAYPSLGTLAAESRMSERQVRRCLRNLEASGAISRTGTTPRGINVYHVHMEGHIVPPQGAEMSPPGGQDVPPYIEPSLEPEVGTEVPTRARKIDPLWETLVDELGEVATQSERGRRNKALKELREVGATPDDVQRRVKTYRRLWPNVTLTATALAANWSLLANGNGRRSHPPPPPCPECGIGGGMHVADCSMVAT